MQILKMILKCLDKHDLQHFIVSTLPKIHYDMMQIFFSSVDLIFGVDLYLLYTL